ncbi:hypothetical protein RHSIM_Rhsim02G0041200 [Rhododendron simsii]|uniref:Ubiquitin-like domain-containing protein n=1 Tax=Rhododendron simsii TaxID=118357 RepID=A0A834HCE3_RHOSS|nr:hypothetical protein RHSIM_Rhsim02G0041200 [Rhododendron simsii]
MQEEEHVELLMFFLYILNHIHRVTVKRLAHEKNKKNENGVPVLLILPELLSLERRKPQFSQANFPFANTYEATLLALRLVKGVQAPNHHIPFSPLENMLNTKEGILSDQFTLVYDGELLDDNRTLASLGIQSESMLYLVLNPRDEVSVSVKMQSREILKLKVKVLQTFQDIEAIVQSMACKEDRVLDVKNKISDKQGVPVRFIHLIFGSRKQLVDDRDLASYNVEKDSILCESFEMFDLWTFLVGLGEGANLPICSRIGSDILDFFQAHYHHHTYQSPLPLGWVESWVGGGILCFKLFFSRSLALHGSTNIIDANAALLWFFTSDFAVKRGTTTVAWKSFKHASVFQVCKEDWVLDVKNKISDKEGFPVRDICLIFGRRTLEDDRDLTCYNVKKDSILRLHTIGMVSKQLQPDLAFSFLGFLLVTENIENSADCLTRLDIALFLLMIRLDEGKSGNWNWILPFLGNLGSFFKVLHTIRDVKAVIWSFVCFVDIDEQDLTYAEKLLENSKTLAYYNIKENSLLEMLPFTYQIFLMDLDGKTHFLRVCKKDRVRDVKSKILHRFGVPVHWYNLAYAGKILKDHEDLAMYNTVKHSHLHVVFEVSYQSFSKYHFNL